ncbi:MAG TPA: ABC transporter substrate-binding protein, partial [Methylomirabilota bacterium]
MMRLLLAVLIAAFAAVPAVTLAQAPNGLVIQVATEPPGLDLTSNPSSAIAAVVFDNVQEGLIKIDRHGKMVPWLAERWYTSDSKNYTFFLRKGVRFHNGRELKASDVKFALDRAVNPETKHPYRVQYDV